MGRKQIYANDSEKTKAWQCRKDKVAYRLVNGYVITTGDKYQPIMEKMNGDNNVNHKVNIVKPTPTPDLDQYHDFLQVINALHVNANHTQKELLDRIVGSHNINDVRSWLLTQYQKNFHR